MPDAVELTRLSILEQGWVKYLKWFARTDSTSTQARRWLDEAKSPDLPALFVADEQTAGRGRSDNQWFSPSGCLMMTLVISGKTLPYNRARWGQLALVTGLVVAETIREETGLEAKLKWPNDVYLGARKCAGVLIESGPFNSTTDVPNWLIGIGLNIDIDWSEAPQDILDKATCLACELGQPVKLTSLLYRLLATFQTDFGIWAAGDGSWLKKWRQRCVLDERFVTIQETSGSIVAGHCQGIDATGQLVVKTAQGTKTILSGQVLSWE